MVFTDLFFMFAFLPICLAAYFAFKSIKAKNVILIITSLIFYSFGIPSQVLLLIGSALVNYILTVFMDKAKGTKRSKLFLVICLIFNLGMLGVFKYTNFMISNINGIFNTSISPLEIIAPLGISFYTFQIISYAIDVYWEKVPVQKHFYKLLLYISLFPKILAGPIVRYETITEEIDNRKTTITDAFEGFTRIIIGISKKVLIADNLDIIVSNCFGDTISEASVAATWIGVIAYSLWVYFDFSSLSDVAIGIARLFGFHFEENFKYPFLCRSISEFWQRWHISLGSFFRDYLLYVPIFGKRRAVLSLFLVWFTTGLWHGASWNYIIWGLYFGVFIFIETKIGKKRLKNAPTPLMHIYNKLVILIGFGIFKFENLGDLGNFFKNLIGANGNAFFNDAAISAVKPYLFIFIIAILGCFPIAPYLKRRFDASGPTLASLAMVCTVVFLVLLLFLDTIALVDSNSISKPYLYMSF